MARGCLHLRATEPDCRIEGGAAIPFYTGRSDCSGDTGPGVRDISITDILAMQCMSSRLGRQPGRRVILTPTVMGR